MEALEKILNNKKIQYQKEGSYFLINGLDLITMIEYLDVNYQKVAKKNIEEIKNITDQFIAVWINNNNKLEYNI